MVGFIDFLVGAKPHRVALSLEHFDAFYKVVVVESLVLKLILYKISFISDARALGLHALQVQVGLHQVTTNLLHELLTLHILLE